MTPITMSKGLRLNDNGDGRAQLRRALTMFEQPARNYFWKSTLEDIVPTTATDIIGAYTHEIEISNENRADILEILSSDDTIAKGQLIAAASNQGQIPFLNQLFQELRKKGIRLNLSHVDLSNLALPGIDLSHAELTGANLQGCNLRHARFRHADLSGASLIKTDLYGARLTHTTLKRANLEYADLDSADLRGGSDLSHARLDHAILRDTRLDGAVMIKVSLNHAHIHRVNLTNANLTNVQIMHSQMTYTSLSGANLSKSNFSHSLLHCVGLKNHPTLKGTIWTDSTAKTIFSDEPTRDAMPVELRPQCVL